MKSKSFVLVFAPVVVSLAAAGLMVLDNLVPGIVSTWMLWEVVLVSAIVMFMAVGALCAIWLGQWLLARWEQERYEPTAEVVQLRLPTTEVLQLRFTQTCPAPERHDEIERPVAVGE